MNRSSEYLDLDYHTNVIPAKAGIFTRSRIDPPVKPEDDEVRKPGMKKKFVYMFIVSMAFLLPTTTHAATINAVHPRVISVISTPTPAHIVRKTPEKKPSLLTNIWNTIGPPILGSTGVIAGTAVAWYTLRKKNKTFTSYYGQISEAQQRYLQNLQSGEMDQAQAKANLKKELTLIQEEAELTAAQKKLDQEQLTAIINKVQRMIDDVGK